MNNLNNKRIQDKRLWVRGQALTAEDEALLQIVKDLAIELGRTPLKRDCKQSAKIKSRFRSWSDVIYACGFSPANCQK